MKKVVLITGGSSEIGYETAKIFAQGDYHIVLTYYQNEEMTKKNAELLRKNYQISPFTMYCDLHQEESIKNLVKEVKNKFGTIDVLINNASVCYEGLYKTKNKQEFMDTLEVNVVGTYLISKEVGEMMYQNKSGVIINLSSTNGMNQYYPMSIDYDASKASILSLTHNLSLAYSPYVRVNAVAPGFIGTKKELEGLDKEFIKSEEEKIFLNRLGKAEEVAEVIYFLASPKASYINNTIIKVDGGSR